ncbi:MAG: CD225/dispanin family protein [Planctomycetaceae bacterium]|jgi:hypothetical protein|nr:CD225/dispanin family protein [Planctomycetaceae bacterium]
MSEYEHNNVNPYAADYVDVENDRPFSGGTPEHIPDYLVWAILETLFCCLPFGIAGIIYSAQANSAKSAGNYYQAIESAKKAKKYLIIGVVGWAVMFVGYITVVAIIAVVGNNNMN